jgi:hypothetical protein
LKKVRLEKAGVAEVLKISMKAYKKLRQGGSIEGYVLAV